MLLPDTHAHCSRAAFSQLLMAGTEIIDVSCGYTHTLILTAHGAVFTCGKGRDGRQGQGGEEDEFRVEELIIPHEDAAAH
jgi:alpha-tubulin suppressor-like RCC1 family protein